MKILICILSLLVVDTFILDYGVEGMLPTATIAVLAYYEAALTKWSKQLQDKTNCNFNENKVVCCIQHQGDFLEVHKLCCDWMLVGKKYTMNIRIDNNIQGGKIYDYSTVNEYCVQYLNFTNVKICATYDFDQFEPLLTKFSLTLMLRMKTTSHQLVSVRFQDMVLDNNKKIVFFNSQESPADVGFISFACIFCNGVKKGINVISGSTEPYGSVNEYIKAIKLFCGWIGLMEQISDLNHQDLKKMLSRKIEMVSKVCLELNTHINESCMFVRNGLHPKPQ